MNKFAYFYFQATCEIMRCMFAGLDDWGKPVWVVTEPGRESLSFDEYYERHHAREEDHFLFVCNTWDKTTTWTLGLMLADRVMYRSNTAEVVCREFISELERYHIKGDGTRHYLKVRVEKQDDGCYQYKIQDVNTDEYLMDDKCSFDNLVDLIDEVLYPILLSTAFFTA